MNESSAISEQHSVNLQLDSDTKERYLLPHDIHVGRKGVCAGRNAWQTQGFFVWKEESVGVRLQSRHRGKPDRKPKLSGSEPPEMSIIT